MAAYNAGPGRVRYAIRKSGTKDYWELQGYLPRETRAYVPGFIAASYVLNYYQDHGLEPAFPGDDLLQTESMPVFQDLAFSQIAQITGVPEEVIYHLNPKYIRKFIPQSEYGHVLILPASAALTMKAYLSSDAEAFIQENFGGIETGVELVYVDQLVEHIYHVKSGDNLYSLAKANDCTVNDLTRWNRLSGSMLQIGQRLKIMRMEKVLVKTVIPVSAVPPVARKTLAVPMLASPGRDFTFTSERTSFTTPEAIPQLRQAPKFNGNGKVLRRRMSARDLGVETQGEQILLVPGANLGRN
jgi:LysM repeat protein